jgi:hypothetical protein
MLGLFQAVSDRQEFITERVGRALQWLRKGFMEKLTVDEFIAYWTALEIVAPELNQLHQAAGQRSYRHCPGCRRSIATCPYCGSDAGTPSPWSGVFELMKQGIGVEKRDFDAIRKFRGGLLHGGSQLTNNAVEAIKGRELPALRRLSVSAVGEALDLQKDIREQLASQKVRRVVISPSFRLLGTLVLAAGSPPAIDRPDLQPQMRSSIGQETYTVTPEGKISVSFPQGFSCTGATCSSKIEAQLWGDETAGMSGTAEIS